MPILASGRLRSAWGSACAPTLVVWPPASVTNLTYRIASGESGLSLELIWPEGTLYSADGVTGPWTIVDGAAAPYYQVPVNPAAAAKFYRV
jgi:hypothetical protein